MAKKPKADPVAEAIAKLEQKIQGEHMRAAEGQLRTEGGLIALEELKEMLRPKPENGQ